MGFHVKSGRSGRGATLASGYAGLRYPGRMYRRICSLIAMSRPRSDLRELTTSDQRSHQEALLRGGGQSAWALAETIGCRHSGFRRAPTIRATAARFALTDAADVARADLAVITGNRVAWLRSRWYATSRYSSREFHAAVTRTRSTKTSNLDGLARWCANPAFMLCVTSSSVA